MIVRLTKSKNVSKPDRLICVRDDGSSTWWPLTPHLVEHDMLHYIVETTLGYQQAFFGLIARGRDIDSFGTKNGQKDTYTEEEGSAELIVGLLQVEMLNGKRHNAAEFDADFFSMLTLTCRNNNWPLPQHLTTEHIKSIRIQMQDLSDRWNKLACNESLELIFPMAVASSIPAPVLSSQR